MRKSRFSDHQILSILKQAEAGTSVPDICREHGISCSTSTTLAGRVASFNLVTQLPHLECYREWESSSLESHNMHYR